MAPVLSKYSTAVKFASVGAVSALTVFIFLKKFGKLNHKRYKAKIEENINEIQFVINEGHTNNNNNKKRKAGVANKKFTAQLCYLIKLIIPGFLSIEIGYVLLIALSLMTRSCCDMWMIQTGTKVETAIVNMNKRLFIRRLLIFGSGLPLIAVVNNILKLGVGRLKIKLRENLTHYFYNQYLKGYTYYKLTNLDNRISNADQLLTNDIDKFSDSFVDLYSNVSKPILDIFIYTYLITTTLGYQTPLLLLGYLVIAGVALIYLRKPITQLTITEQKLEGEFRYVNSRLIAHSEEVAFYNGSSRENLSILASFRKLRNHLYRFLNFRVLIGIADNIIGKYISTIVGFISVSIPFMTASGSVTGLAQEERYRSYYTMGRMLVKLAEAIGRLVMAGREITRLNGFTTRLMEFLNVLQEVNQGCYIKGTSDFKDVISGEVLSKEACKDIYPGAGKMIYEDDIISFDQVPLITPNGDILVHSLSFEIKSGMNVLVCGPNGCGKSSIFRVLGELWPIFGGTLRKPQAGSLFYIPQKPYMTLGTLRDQLIYPHTVQDMKRRKMTDKCLDVCMDRVKLLYLVDKENGWDAVADWSDVLSGGEKQKIAMARLFYHKPKFAILDECTSAVSVDVEGFIYEYCREVGITLFTVSHRRSLWKYHEYCLKMDGHGSYTFKKIEASTEQFGS